MLSFHGHAVSMLVLRGFFAWVSFAVAATPQEVAAPAPDSSPTEFQSHGLDYEALTHNGITVMFANLPPHIKEYNVMQVTVTNGSLVSWTVKPTDFTFIRNNGMALTPVSADDVVESLLEKASHSDVVSLQRLYEDSIYGLANYRPTNGYQQRKDAGLTQFTNRNFRAAAAASAITFVPVKLRPGESTDGAVFFTNRSKDKVLGPGRLVARSCGETFTFQVFPEIKVRP